MTLKGFTLILGIGIYSGAGTRLWSAEFLILIQPLRTIGIERRLFHLIALLILTDSEHNCLFQVHESLFHPPRLFETDHCLQANQSSFHH